MNRQLAAKTKPVYLARFLRELWQSTLRLSSTTPFGTWAAGMVVASVRIERLGTCQNIKSCSMCLVERY